MSRFARTTVELRFLANAPYFLSRIVAVQSTAPGPVSLAGAYHYPLWRASELAKVQPYRSGVPDYWIPIGAWRPPQGDFDFGAIPQHDDPVFTVYFWRDTALHADFLRTLNVDLAPTHTWHAPAPEPWAAIFLTKINKSGNPDLSGVLAAP